MMRRSRCLTPLVNSNYHFADKIGVSSSSAKKIIPVGQKLPICLVATGDSKLTLMLAHDLFAQGILVKEIKSLNEYLEHSKSPGVFSFFVNIAANPWALKLLREKKIIPKEIWAAVTPKLTTAQNSLMFNLGFSDVLTLPLHPVTVRSRARMFLSRFVKTAEFPEDIKLPTGIKRPPRTHKPVRITSQTGREQTKNRARHLKVRGSFGKHKVEPEKIPIFEVAVNDLSGPQGELFEPISPKKRLSILREFSEKNPNPLVWVKGQKWKSNLIVESVKPQENIVRFKFPPGVSKLSFTGALGPHEVEEVFISLPLRRGRAFFACPKAQIQVDAFGFTARIPDQIFQTQRRRDFRLQLNPVRGLLVHIRPSQDKPRMTFMATNISAGGCQLVLSEAQAALFRKNSFCPEIDFSIYDKKIPCGGQVKWKAQTSNTKDPERDAYRVGIEFVHMSESDQEGIQLFVLEESFGYIKSFIT